MRIGLVTGEYPPMEGGMGAYSRILAQTLTAQGHSLFIYSTPQTQESDLTLNLTNAAHNWRWMTQRAINKWAKTNQLDVISLQFETAAYRMSPWIHFLPDMIRAVPVVTTFHDLLFPYLFPKAGLLRDWIVMHLACASAGVIATNHEDMARLCELPYVTLIPIGSNIQTAPPPNYNATTWRAKAGAAPNEFLLANFGFANRSKGLDLLLEVVSALRAEGLPLKLVLVGGRTGSSDPSNDAYAKEIDAKIEQLGLTPHITRTGFVNDSEVSAYLRAADVVVLPFRDGASYRRGSLMAAIHQGCAIITTKPQLQIPAFTDGENMLLADSDSENQGLTEAIRRLCQAPNERRTLQQGARELAKYFDWEHIARDYVNFFVRILGGRR